jgi:hypothetical protein
MLLQTQVQFDNHCKGMRVVPLLCLCLIVTSDSEHVVCGLDGCTVSIHPGLLAEHRLVHTPFVGCSLYCVHCITLLMLLFQVQKLMAMSEDEVAAWREERRRNWPTTANIVR